MITEIKSMKTQLSLPFLLKTNELDIFIFDRDKKGNISFKNDPLRFIAHRTHSYCSDVVNTVESDDKIIVIDSDGFVIEEYQKWNSLEEILSADKALEELLIMTYHKMVVDSKPLPDDFAKLISDNILDLF